MEVIKRERQSRFLETEFFSKSCHSEFSSIIAHIYSLPCHVYTNQKCHKILYCVMLMHFRLQSAVEITEKSLLIQDFCWV